MQKKTKKEVVVATTNAREDLEGDEKLEAYQDVSWFLNFYNETMAAHHANIPHPLYFLTQGRGGQEGMLKRRQAKYGKEGVRQVIINAAKSPFLNFRTKNRFLATLNWILRKDKFPLILQGEYGEPDAEELRLTPEEQRQQELERYRAQQEARRAEVRRIDEEERARREAERDSWAKTSCTYEEYQRLLKNGQLTINN